MSRVKIQKFESLGKNPRGEGFSIFSPKKSDSYLLVNRVKGSISGNHYHKGLIPEKKPELVFLIHGTLNLITKDLENEDESTFVIDTPSMIEIPSYIVHVFKAVTDITFLECNSLEDHKKDTEAYELLTK